jgi:hypothetical protein
MSSISGITSSSPYAAEGYQAPAPKSPAPGTAPSAPSPAPSGDSIDLSPAGQAALKSPEPTKMTHAQLVLSAESGDPVSKAKLKTEKVEAGLSPCS